MNQTICRAVLLAAALSATAAAQSGPEILSVSAGARFDAAIMGMSGARFRPQGADGRLPSDEAAGWVKELREKSAVLTLTGYQAAVAGPAADFDLASALNSHLKTNLRYQLSGRTVWFSGAFDKGQKPYVSILVDGYQPLYFDVKALLNQDQRLYVGNQIYTLSLSANIFHRMKSSIILKNESNSREFAKFSVQDMLDAVERSGRLLHLSDQDYRFYYSDGLNGGKADPAARMFVFIAGSSSDFHVFLIPADSVPSDRLGVFQMFNGKRVGLTNRNGHLEVYENP
ncbi:MAG: hypothetical protein KGL74_13000 [Elusimicrobia bacterium]|nr:hypothetical protein [Elusimicrobiota bacterium]MDE2512034.1 hypothetical protein [Elusimicrobiota bacterium]